MVEAFPIHKDEWVYVLMDSWYTVRKGLKPVTVKDFMSLTPFKPIAGFVRRGLALLWMISLSSTSASLTSPPRYRRGSGKVLGLRLRGTGERHRKRQTITVLEVRIYCFEQTAGLSPVHGSISGSRYDPEVLPHALEYRDGVSIL